MGAACFSGYRPGSRIWPVCYFMADEPEIRPGSAYIVWSESAKDNTPPDALVGALEIGAIGYYSDRPIVDFAGLIQLRRRYN